MIEKILSSRMIRGALTVIFLTAGVAYWQQFFVFIETADTFFAMNLGRYVLEHSFPHVDPFTIHENLQLVAQQWLSGVFFWEAYKNLGVNGLLLLDWICGAVSILIYWRLCLLVGENKFAALATAFVVGLLVSTMFIPRPQIFSTPLFVAEIFFLEKFTRTGDAKFLFPLPFLSTLLINFHAAIWMMSLVLCLPFLFVRNVRHVKFLFAAMAGIILGGLINPYGVDAMTYVLRSYGINLINAHVPEMFAPSAQDLQGKIFYVTEAVVIFTLAKFNAPWRYVFLSGGIIFLAMLHTRNLILFYFLATLPIAYATRNFSAGKFFAGDGQHYPPTHLSTYSPTNFGTLTLLFFLILLANTAPVIMILDGRFDELSLPLKITFTAATLFMLYNLLVVKFNGRILHPTILPRKILLMFVSGLILGGIFATTADTEQKSPTLTYTHAIEFLLRSERPENISLYVPQGIGGLAGSYGIRYYIDSRSEVFLRANNGRKNIFAEYVDFISGKLDCEDFFGRYDFTHIIITNNSPFIFDALSRDKNFRVIYESEHFDGCDVVRCKIFVPKGRD